MRSAELMTTITEARERAADFLKALEVKDGWKYTQAHDTVRFPAGILYGTWSVVLGLRLLGGNEGLARLGEKAATVLASFKQDDGTFLPSILRRTRSPKSLEYLKLHCTNYSLGALAEIDGDFDWQSRFMDVFLDGDFLGRWLEGRSLLRPWEEGNNIVNVAGWLALCNDSGVPGASARLEQLLEWHRRNQNPKTGGFDCFENPTPNQQLQALAGAVHNFHLHLYMGERYGHEDVIAANVLRVLRSGPLTACLSLDFVELAIRTLRWAPDPQLAVDALMIHAESLLKRQNCDGGWFESEDGRSPTIAAGFREDVPSSCSYATWFRLCSLGQIAIVVLGDSPEHWHFRSTLGMGYAPRRWPTLPSGVRARSIPFGARISAWRERTIASGRRLIVRSIKWVIGS